MSPKECMLYIVTMKFVSCSMVQPTVAAIAIPESNYQHKEGDLPSMSVITNTWSSMPIKKCYLTTKRKTNKSYCIVDPLLLEEPKSTLPVFEYCCHAAHNTALLFQLETAALVLPAPLRALFLFLIPHCQYRVKSSKEEKGL